MSEQPHESGHPSGYEKRDASVRGVLITALVVVVLIVVALVGLWDYFVATREEIVYEQTLRPASQQLIELQKLEDSILIHYEFIDSISGRYRIPIARAMELMADESTGTVRP